jgi:beta-galactosidase
MLVLVTALSFAAESLFDDDWHFFRGDDESLLVCSNETFPQDLGQTYCSGLNRFDVNTHARMPSLTTAEQCQRWCCEAGDSCNYWQFCPKGQPCTSIPVPSHAATGIEMQGCWIDNDGGSDATRKGTCAQTTDGWISRARGAVTTGRRVFSEPKFDDSTWRTVDTPHDWSIEDLPSREEDKVMPVLSTRYGDWSFAKGDNPAWSAPGFDDSSWQHVKGGEDWRVHSNYTISNATGWYRQHLPAIASGLLAAPSLPLDLGLVSGVDFTYLNGVLIGNTGNIGALNSSHPDCSPYTTWRSYNVPAGLLKPSGNVLAVRVFSIGGPAPTGPGSGYPGGLYDDTADDDNGELVGDHRRGAFDPGASANIKGQYAEYGASVGYALGGVGWYRKEFALPAATRGKRVSIKFDGVYCHADTYINGHYLGHHPYGYTAFGYDITEYLLLAPAKNVVAVRVANRMANSRWYSGSGIYRHVHLSVTDAVHFKQWGVAVDTPSVQLSMPPSDFAAVAATVRVNSTLVNHGASDTTVNVALSLTAPDGTVIQGPARVRVVPAGGEATLTVDVVLGGALHTPQLWSDRSPSLYTAEVRLADTAQQSSDLKRVTFGIRTLKFSAASGFQLNGRSLKMYGGCVHHDNGILGAAAIDRAEERKVQLLKAQGYNAIRTAHNPYSPAFLDACDREGMLVMGEAFDTWAFGKNDQDYHTSFSAWWQRDIAALVLRDRNHPSVVMWSIGNEVRERECVLSN